MAQKLTDLNPQHCKRHIGVYHKAKGNKCVFGIEHYKYKVGKYRYLSTYSPTRQKQLQNTTPHILSLTPPKWYSLK
jgi:hypothetical protein